MSEWAQSDFITCICGNLIHKVHDTCPHCDATLAKPSRKKRPVPVVMEAKPPTPKLMSKTAKELTIPIEVHGVLIWYIRQPDKKPNQKKEPKITAYYYDGHWHSVLELWFWVKWKATGQPMPTPEYRFHKKRQWKFDFCFEDYRIAVEMEGGAHSRGRHTRGIGFKNDIEKYNEATALGWRVYRFASTEDKHIKFMQARISEAMRESEKAA